MPPYRAKERPPSETSRAYSQRPRQAQPAKKSVACSRCHEKKMKCSGETPCARCKAAGHFDSCRYVARDRKIRVDESYFQQLINDSQELHRQRRNRAVDPSTQSSYSTERLYPQNATTAGPSLPIHIGETACTAFATRISQCLNGIDMATCPLRWDYVDESQLASLLDNAVEWPSLVHARLLLQTVFTNICPAFHLALRKDTYAMLSHVYQRRKFHDAAVKAKYFALFALGKAYSTLPSPDAGCTPAPGSAYFVKALSLVQLAPERPTMMHLETILALALYQKFLNRFHSAYLLIGNALRLGLSLRLHCCPGGESVRPVDREHRIRLWWTIYIMDRFWGLKCGLPVQVNDSDIQVDLPADLLDDREREQLPDPALQIASIFVARLAGNISQQLYGPRKPGGCFLQHEQSLLAQSHQWLESLPDSLKLKPAGDNSRNVTVLHLQFHYCVILAIRPALLHALPRKADSTPDTAVDTMSANMMAILETCGHTAKHSISMCIYAWTKGFIGMLSYDFPAFLFSAVLALHVTGHIQGAKIGDIPEVETAREILQILETSGNIASKAFNLHLQSVLKSFENHGRTAAAADKVPRSAVDKVASQSGIQSLAPEFNMAVESFSWLLSAEMMTTEMAFDQTNMQQFLANDELAVAPQDKIDLFNDPMSLFWWLDQPLYTE
ncbi:hypothetical protein BB8028_0007g03300 [Beauveria bassiana]|uniref:Zn(2)-C6 fungal-type domain-containing protein n=1 Tax=Beauveria bassiana TaxID=176275 RepID=A0A2S7YLR8_BEABA|nr:hypothetical protein BB8028_0007g03300 [Beauveria bassiana]